MSVSRRQADHWAAAGEILCDLYPGLDPSATEATDLGTNGSVLPCAGRPGAAFAARRLRPLVALKNSGYLPVDLREVWAETLAHSIEPTERQVRAEVIKRKRESLRGKCSPQGAETLRRLLALHVYDLVRYESESDELAVMCRDAIMSVLWDFAAAEQEEDEADIYERQGREWLGDA